MDLLSKRPASLWAKMETSRRDLQMEWHIGSDSGIPGQQLFARMGPPAGFSTMFGNYILSSGQLPMDQ